MWNRKRSNSWLITELFLVFCLTWLITDYLFVYVYNNSLPNYRNVENTLKVNLSEFDENHPDYDPEANTPEALEANYARILQNIRTYPGIEAISVSFDGSTPGGTSSWGKNFVNVKDTTITGGGQCITMDPNEDYLKVFGFSTDDGAKKISVKDFDWGANGIVLNRISAKTMFPDGNAIGQELRNYGNPNERYTVVGIIDNTKRFDYLRPQIYFYLTRRYNAENLKKAEISVRYSQSVNENRFEEQFKSDMANMLQIGNFYLLSIIPYTKINDNTRIQFGYDSIVKQIVYIGIFFLLCIYLCVTGTFWYRISLRTNETGIRKATGATNTGIRNMMIGEGIWLLVIIAIPAMLLEYQFVHADIIPTLGRQSAPDPQYLPDRIFVRFLIINAITFLFLFVVITSAIWLPANKAASLCPADALHDE